MSKIEKIEEEDLKEVFNYWNFWRNEIVKRLIHVSVIINNLRIKNGLNAIIFNFSCFSFFKNYGQFLIPVKNSEDNGFTNVCITSNSFLEQNDEALIKELSKSKYVQNTTLC